jgi:uncharacterized membrane protein HdeD (DUF308 family)
MVAVRGVLAVLFGLTLALWRDATLPVVVVAFGAYALLDGLWAIASVLAVAVPRGEQRALEVWAVVLEGLLGVGVGVLALGWPLVSGEFVTVLALWAAATGALEIFTAALLPRATVAPWLLGTAGVLSVFLAVLVVLVPRADGAGTVGLIALYAIAFGVLLSAAALRFHAPRHARHLPHPGA